MYTFIYLDSLGQLSQLGWSSQGTEALALKEAYGIAGEDRGDSEKVVNPPPIYGLHTKILQWLRGIGQVGTSETQAEVCRCMVVEAAQGDLSFAVPNGVGVSTQPHPGVVLECHFWQFLLTYSVPQLKIWITQEVFHRHDPGARHVV